MEEIAAWSRFYGMCCCMPILVAATVGALIFFLIRNNRKKSKAAAEPQKKDLTLVLDIPGKGKVSITEPMVLGRENGLGQLQDDRTVSWNHAKVGPWKGRFYIADLDSTNGTYLNGRKVTELVQLNPGDRIRLGRTELQILDIGYQPRKQRPSPNAGRQPKPKTKQRSRRQQNSPVVGTWWNIDKHGELPPAGEGIWFHQSDWPDSWRVLCPLSKQGPLTPPRFGMRWDPKQGKWKN